MRIFGCFLMAFVVLISGCSIKAAGKEDLKKIAGGFEFVYVHQGIKTTFTTKVLAISSLGVTMSPDNRILKTGDSITNTVGGKTAIFGEVVSYNPGRGEVVFWTYDSIIYR